MTTQPTHHSDAAIRIITTIGVVVVLVDITMDTYLEHTSTSWVAPGHKEQPGTIIGHGILSWCYTIKSATDKDGNPFTNLSHYKDQIDMRVRLQLHKLLQPTTTP